VVTEVVTGGAKGREDQPATGTIPEGLVQIDIGAIKNR
jgi:hypothetical protein